MAALLFVLLFLSMALLLISPIFPVSIFAFFLQVIILGVGVNTWIKKKKEGDVSVGTMMTVSLHGVFFLVIAAAFVVSLFTIEKGDMADLGSGVRKMWGGIFGLPHQPETAEGEQQAPTGGDAAETGQESSNTPQVTIEGGEPSEGENQGSTEPTKTADQQSESTDATPENEGEAEKVEDPF